MGRAWQETVFAIEGQKTGMKTAPKRWKPSTGISFPAAGAFQVRVAPGAPGVWMAFALIGGNWRTGALSTGSLAPAYTG